jgi:hypothetical protein
MDRHHGRHFEGPQNLFAGRIRIERGANVAACSVRITLVRETLSATLIGILSFSS